MRVANFSDIEHHHLDRYDLTAGHISMYSTLAVIQMWHYMFEACGKLQHQSSINWWGSEGGGGS